MSCSPVKGVKSLTSYTHLYNMYTNSEIESVRINVKEEDEVKTLDVESVQDLNEKHVLSLVFRQRFRSPKWLDPRPDRVVSLRHERVGLGIPSRPLAVNVP